MVTITNNSERPYTINLDYSKGLKGELLVNKVEFPPGKPVNVSDEQYSACLKVKLFEGLVKGAVNLRPTSVEDPHNPTQVILVKKEIRTPACFSVFQETPDVPAPAETDDNDTDDEADVLVMDALKQFNKPILVKTAEALDVSHKGLNKGDLVKALCEVPEVVAVAEAIAADDSDDDDVI